MAAYTQFNWGKSPKLSSNHRWFLLRETLRNSALQILIIKKKKFRVDSTANNSRESKERVRPVPFPVLSSKTCSHSHFLSLLHLQVSHMGVLLSQNLRDNRHEKTHPQAPLTKSSHRHAHKKKSFTAF